MLYRHTVLVSSLIGLGVVAGGFIPHSTVTSAYHQSTEATPKSEVAHFVTAETAVDEGVPREATATGTEVSEDIQKEKVSEIVPKPKKQKSPNSTVRSVPFFSQFTDISTPEWRKVGCGIASLAMLIEYYEPNSVTVDELLEEGIEANAFLTDAGWTHGGLISLSHKYGLSGESHDLGGSSMDSAFEVLKDELEEGPVMASVHYTFDPKNPIPHLVVVNGVRNGKVYYNDPSESAGGGSISITQFQSAWKKRYIDIRPV